MLVKSAPVVRYSQPVRPVAGFVEPSGHLPGGLVLVVAPVRTSYHRPVASDYAYG